MSIKVRVSPLLAKVEAREDDGIGRSSEVQTPQLSVSQPIERESEREN